VGKLVWLPDFSQKDTDNHKSGEYAYTKFVGILGHMNSARLLYWDS